MFKPRLVVGEVQLMLISLLISSFDFDSMQQMADECFTLLDKGYVERSTKTITITEDESTDYAFLEQIITPIYNIVAAVRSLMSYAPRI